MLCCVVLLLLSSAEGIYQQINTRDQNRNLLSHTHPSQLFSFPPHLSLSCSLLLALSRSLSLARSRPSSLLSLSRMGHIRTSMKKKKWLSREKIIERVEGWAAARRQRCLSRELVGIGRPLAFIVGSGFGSGAEGLVGSGPHTRIQELVNWRTLDMSRPSVASRLPNSPIASANQTLRPAPLTEACVEHKFGGAVMGPQRADVQTEVRDTLWDAPTSFSGSKKTQKLARTF